MTEHFSYEEGSVRVRLDEDEARLLRRVVAEMLAVLDEDAEGDPALQRLFPDVYDDPEDNAAYRDLVGDELRSGKVQALETVARALGDTGPIDRVVAQDEAHSWLTSLTDLRLTLGARLGITEDLGSEELDPSHPDAPVLGVLHWLGWLQESLLEAIDPEYRRTHG